MKMAWRLFRVQLSALLGFNALRHMKDRKERLKKGAGKLAIWICMLCVLPADILYSYAMASGLQAMGALSAFPAVMLALTCMMTLITSIPSAGGALFRFKDYEQVMSLPIKDSDIALSRLILVYTYNLLFSLLLLPAGSVYAYLARPAWPFYPIYLITWVFAPILPMMIGCALGALASWATARLKGSKYFSMILSAGISLAIIYFSTSMGSDGNALFVMMGGFAKSLSDLAERIYPLTGIYMQAINDFNLLSALLFVGLSALVFYLMALFFGRNLRRINTALNTTHAHGRFRMKQLRTASPLRALYRREMKHYVSIPVYLMNTAFSLLMALFALIMLAIKLGDVMSILPELLGELSVSMDEVCILGGLAISVFTGMCCTTGSSISLEGKQLWLIKTLPVNGYHVMLAKLMVNWTLVLPASVIFSTLLAILLKASALGTLWLLILPLLFSLLFPMIGLLINLKSHSFDWTNETSVVKQSAASGLSIFVGMLLPIGFIALCVWQMERIYLMAGLIALFQALASGVLLLLISRRATQWLRKL